MRFDNDPALISALSQHIWCAERTAQGTVHAVNENSSEMYPNAIEFIARHFLLRKSKHEAGRRWSFSTLNRNLLDLRVCNLQLTEVTSTAGVEPQKAPLADVLSGASKKRKRQVKNEPSEGEEEEQEKKVKVE